MVLLKLSRKILIGLGMVSIFALAVGGILLMTFSSRVLVLEGDHVFDSDYIVPRGRKVIFRNGVFSFTNDGDCIKVYGTFIVENVTVEGDIRAFDHSKVQILDSPHTVDEIYAYNNSRITINNSMVHKVYAYDSTIITIDDSTFYGMEGYPNVIYGDILTLINDLNSTINTLNQTLETLTNTPEELEQLTAMIDSLNSALDNLETNFDALNNTMLNINMTLSQDITTLDAALTAIETRLTSLENAPGQIRQILTDSDGLTYLLPGETYPEEHRINIKRSITVQEGADLRVEYSGVYCFYYTITVSRSYNISIEVRNSTWYIVDYPAVRTAYIWVDPGLDRSYPIHLVGTCVGLPADTYFIRVVAQQKVGVNNYIMVGCERWVTGVFDGVDYGSGGQPWGRYSELIITEYSPNTFS
ncbi:MAG: hypothetical protein ACFFDT_03340 [Candidatus Hodarchaeota archaeon]